MPNDNNPTENNPTENNPTDQPEESMEELMRAANEEAIRMIVPDCWASASQDLFVHWDEEEKCDMLLTEKQQKRFLKGLGLRGTKLRTEAMSEVETEINRSVTKFKVHYVGEIACLPHGVSEVGKYRFYNTGELQLSEITPEIEESFAAFLGGRNSEQYSEIMGLLRLCHGYLSAGEWPDNWLPPLLMLVGDSEVRADKFCSLFRQVLGGEKIDPAPYFRKAGSNAGLAGALHWNVGYLPSQAILSRLYHIDKLTYGKNDEVSLPFLPIRTVFILNAAKERKNLPPKSVLGAKTIYLSSVGAGDDSYAGPGMKESFFHDSLAGDAYHILCHAIGGSKVVVPKGELLVHLESSSHHFRSRMSREKETVETIMETIAGQYPDQVKQISPTYWQLDLPKPTQTTTQPNEQPSDNDDLGQ